MSVSEGERLVQGDGDGRGQGDGDGREREDGGGFRRLSGSETLTEGMSFTAGSGGERERKTIPTPVTKKVERRPVSISFKEKLLSPGGLGFLVSHDEEDDIVSGWRGFFAKKNEEMENGDWEEEARRVENECITPQSQYPVLSMTEEQYTSWCRPWINSLIIKVLGLSVPKHVLFDRVRRMWKPQQPLKVVPLNNGYYIVSFSNKEDRDYEFSEGPWMIDDHYLLVQRWRPNFNPWRADRQRKIAVWVRIPDLPMEFCTVESLGLIGNMIGKIVKIDRSTSIYEKGGFARICVEIDLQSPLLPAFKVFGEERQLVYEGLHFVCFGCGKYGHDQGICPDRVGCDENPGATVTMNDKAGQMTQIPADGDKTTTEQNTAAAGPNTAGDESQSGRGPGFSKEDRRRVEESKRKSTGNNEKTRRTEKLSEVDGRKEGAGGECLETPVFHRPDGVRPVESGRRDFLGPQMLMRRDFRRGLNGLENLGGVIGGSNAKKGMAQEKTEGMTRGSREGVGEPRGVFLKGIKQNLLIGGESKKSNSNSGPSEKPKSEWIMVGSKRKMEEKPKVFGKENKLNERPNFKLKEAVDKGAHFVEITNQYSFLPTEDMKDDVEVVQQINYSKDPLTVNLADVEMGVGANVPDSGFVTEVTDSKGRGLAHTTPTLS
ncbi:hypothetical protein K1719_037186 [Acacia pycnantha]|nr:hypothetical protein K1719_037186 [Acacia pycnantha]